MNIGNVKINGKVALAPMASVADRAYRTLCKEFGACYLVSEMVSAKGICYNDNITAELCTITDFERPMAIQLFGSEPEYMAKATKRILEFKPDVIDINMGCPVPKVVKQGAGSALMRTPDLAADLIKAVKSETDIPVTVKIRLGWDEISALPFAEKMEKAGADAITIHGRTKKQLYSGEVDLEIIQIVKEHLSIPIIGNGNIFNLDDSQKMYETGVDLIMVGRGSYGNPWLFKEIEKGKNIDISLEERLNVCLHQVDLLRANYDDFTAIRIARRVVSYYLKGLKNSAYYRNLCHNFNKYEDVLSLIQEVKNANND
ncbi:MAG: tRNA dihydrouridine synthase DusB, partial [Oscillospiraceae bacterium]|nr:tRNA dihydrouridine synthase DusB [Oscillospiraceae bacterium]